jgi:hypothetical protein
MSLWLQGFFGLTDEYRPIQLRHLLFLVTRLRFTYKDAYNLPIWKRNFFIDTYLEEQKKSNEANSETASTNTFRKSYWKDIYI